MSVQDKLTQLSSIKADIKAAIIGRGIAVGEDMKDYAAAISRIGGELDLNPYLLAPMDATAINLQLKTGSINVSYNDNIKIVDANGKAWTISEWHDRAVSKNFDKSYAAPVAFRFHAASRKFDWYFDNKYRSTQNRAYYDVSGTVQQADGKLRHSQWSHPIVRAGYSKVDLNGTTATATVSGDEVVLSTTNSPKTWRIKKTFNVYNAFILKSNFDEYMDALLAETEWFRHRAAIDSGLSTTEADGTVGAVTIVSEGGELYFAINGHRTDKLAKYNMHAIMNGDNPTEAIINAIYSAQKSNGTNMNATCGDGSSRPVVTEGSDGATAYAFNGKWMITTPILTRCSATLSMDYNIPDAPCVAYVRNYMSQQIGKTVRMPHELEISAYQCNRNTILNSMVSYLNASNGEAWGIPTTIDVDAWSFVCNTALSAWYVTTSGHVNTYNVVNRVVGAAVSAL